MSPERPSGVALITGVSGQDGHYLSRQLLNKDYRVHGLLSPSGREDGCLRTNHELPCRPERFVTRKITKAVAAIAAGRQDRLALGDLTIKCDWGWASNYVDALYRIALHGKGDDFVVATGVKRSIAGLAGARAERFVVAASPSGPPWSVTRRRPQLSSAGGAQSRSRTS